MFDMMYLLTIFVILPLNGFTFVVSTKVPIDLLSDAAIDLINKEGKWEAGRNFHPDTPMSYITRLFGERKRDADAPKIPVVKHDKELMASLPANFDAREKWSNCPSLKKITDQGKCASCWAVSATEAMTDRVCTYSNGTKNFRFSAEDLIECNGMGDFGCDGGLSFVAWATWVDKGLVSGGDYNSHEGCKPYNIPPCDHGAVVCNDSLSTPKCVEFCEKGYNLGYYKDKRKGKSLYDVVGEDNIMAEIFKNGPVTATYTAYADFLHYKSGVYRHVYGGALGGHAVKILGWGVENGAKYWLAANSWTTQFGEKGFFKFLRGVDECEIESQGVFGGEPLLEMY